VKTPPAGRLSNCLVITLLFIYDARPFRNFPGRLQFVKFGEIYTDLRIRLWVIYRDCQFQGVVIQPAVLREVHLLASRIAKGIGPDLIVKPDRDDHKYISLPFAY